MGFQTEFSGLLKKKVSQNVFKAAMEDKNIPQWLCDDVSLPEMAQLFAITKHFLPPAQEGGHKVIGMEGRMGTEHSELHYFRSFDSKSRLSSL